MLAMSIVHEIARLLFEGELSQRQIARRLGVSRGTVQAIASGRRGLHGKAPAGDHSVSYGSSPAMRCPRCGYRIHVPCLVCRSRQHRERQRILRLIASCEPHSST
jgi:hypothetical protein